MQAEHPFHFVTQIEIVEVTGKKAKDLNELLTHLKQSSGAVFYFHTHHFLKQHQFLSPEPPNDFAYWASNVLQETTLGEQLASIDTVKYPSLSALSEKIVQVIEAYVQKTKSMRTASPGNEFHLMKSQSFVLPTPYNAINLQEFYEAVKKVSIRSLYHHIFQARMRLGKPTNDFSHWLATELDEAALAKSISRLDPYTQTLEDLRRQILALIERRLSENKKEDLAHATA